MEKKPLELTMSEYKNYMNKVDFLGQGQYGKVFKFEDNLALKLWFDYTFNIDDLLHITFPNCKTPMNKVIVENCVKGYLMEYCEGQLTTQLPIDTLLSLIISALKINYVNFKTISEEQFLIADVHPRNVMYNQTFSKTGFNFIDCDSWKKVPFIPSQECFYENIYRLNGFIMQLLKVRYYGLKNILKNNSKLTYRLDKIEAQNSTESYQFFQDVVHYLEDNYDVKIKTLKDFRKITR